MPIQDTEGFAIVERLTNLFSASNGVQVPGYQPDAHSAGIVHFGVGAFHRSHQAVYTDDVLALHGGDWRIIGVSLQSTAIADAINQQNGLYSLLTRSTEDSAVLVRVIGSIQRLEAATRSTAGIYQALADERTKIVTMTVTEKAYGIDRTTNLLDISNPVIAHDLERPNEPTGLVGIIVKGLSSRKDNGLPPFTVLCCDNLPDNGEMIRNAVVDFARRTNAALAEWIVEYCAFPSTMVDRITPATTPELVTEVASALSVSDKACVEAEQYSQWVIEDNFTCGRPRWEDVGVLFVDDVAPYEKMKLRMLNGAHSLIAYVGFLCGFRFVREAMSSLPIKNLVETHISAAALTLPDLNNVDFEEYKQELVRRFANINIAHETYQIAMDGSQKMPQRIFEPALESIQRDLPIDTFAFAAAAWLRYCSGKDANGSVIDIRDPRESELTSAYSSGQKLSDVGAENVCNSVFKLSGIVPPKLAQNDLWLSKTSLYLDIMLKSDMQSALVQVTRDYNPCT